MKKAKKCSWFALRKPRIRTVLLVIFLLCLLALFHVISIKEYRWDKSFNSQIQQEGIEKMSLAPNWAGLESDSNISKKVFEQPSEYSWDSNVRTYQLTGVYLGKMPALRGLHKENSPGRYIKNENVNALLLRFRIAENFGKVTTACFNQKMVLANLNKETVSTRANNLDNVSSNFCQRSGGVVQDVPLMFLIPEGSEKLAFYMEGNKETILIEKEGEELKIKNIENIDSLGIKNYDLKEIFGEFFGKKFIETPGEEDQQNKNGGITDLEISVLNSEFSFLTKNIDDKKIKQVFKDDSVGIVVQLKNKLGEPLTYKEVKLVADRDGKDDISATAEMTNKSGEVRFLVIPGKKGVVKLSLTVGGDKWPESLVLDVRDLE